MRRGGEEEPHRIGAVTRDGMRSGVNRVDFHLTSKAEWFHSAKTEWCDTGLPRRRVTEPPYPMRKAIRCVMNPVSCNWGLSFLIFWRSEGLVSGKQFVIKKVEKSTCIMSTRKLHTTRLARVNIYEKSAIVNLSSFH